MTAALQGLRIVELGSGPAVSLAGMVLAQYGADVVKIEPPHGHGDRSRPGWHVWHRNKRSLAADLGTDAGYGAVRSLVDVADGLVLGLRPGRAEQLGVDHETLSAANPALVTAVVTGFGERGPLAGLAGTEQLVAAMSGRMQSYDGVRPGPIYTPAPIGGYGAAMLLVEGLLAALWQRDRTGRGQRVHTSLLHALSVYDMTSGHGNRTNIAPQPGRVYGVMRVPFMTAPCRDGRFLQMCSRQPHHYRRWLTLLGLDALFDDPELANMPDLWPSEQRLAEVVETIQDRMRQRTADEWMALFAEHDIGGDPFLAPDEYLAHPQARDNGRVVEFTDDRVGPTTQIGPLAVFSDTPAAAPTSAPDTPATSLSWTAPRVAIGGGADAADRPLAGVTIVECGYFYATPFAATLLAEAGARVIKVEPPSGDPGRRNWTTSYSKAQVGKESVVVDLKTADGLRIMHELVDRADVFIHNFRPGTPERLGIGYEQLAARNPELLYVYGSCFGSEGPWAAKAGFHSSPNAIAGCGVVESGAGNPPRNRTYGDPVAALGLAAAIAVGLHARARTGRGQYLETTMLSSMGYVVAEWGASWEGKVDTWVDADQNGFDAHRRLYETVDGWLLVDCVDDRDRAGLLDAVGVDTADAIEGAIAARPADEWVSELAAAGIPAARADGADFLSFMLDDPHVRAAGVAVEADQDDLGIYWRAGPALDFSAAPTPLDPSPPLGACTATVLAELGYDDAEIARLDAEGVTRPVGHGLPS